MILDQLPNAKLYHPLHARLALALAALATDLPNRPEGRYELDGDHVFAMVQTYDTLPRSQCVWEAHRRYTDVQYIVEGRESMGHALLGNMCITTPFDPAKDVEFFEGEGAILTLSPGDFAVFFPHDVHMPKLAAGPAGRVKKVVIKVELP